MKPEDQDSIRAGSPDSSDLARKIADLPPGSIRRIMDEIKKRKKDVSLPRKYAGARVSPLEKIRTSGTNRPVFFLHPAGGGVKSYHELAKHMDVSHPVYAFQNHIFGSHEVTPYLSIEEMAARYIEELGTVQAGGPYILAGWSMGGTIAFEMALQLEQRQQSVSPLVLIDSCAQPHRASEQPSSQQRADDLILIGNSLALAAGRDLRLSGNELRGLPKEDQICIFCGILRRQKIVAEHIDDGAIRALLATLENSDRAIESYIPHIYSGKVTVFRASDTMAGMRESARAVCEDSAFGWQPYCAQPVATHFVPGDHMRMMSPPNIETLGRALQQCIDNAEVE